MSGLGSNNGPQASLQPGLASPLNRATKRIFDIVATVLLFATLIPIFGIVSLLITLDGGPIFSTHERTGLGGRTFRCLRFRTTIYDSDTNPNEEARVSAIGSFLRLTGIDALPQFVNVLRGEMSLVGSGPALQREAIGKHNGVDRQRPIIRPGLTGLWRVWNANRSNDARGASLDERYFQEWSLWTDILILIRSTPDIVFGPSTSAPKGTEESREQ